jgi:hypothetical protein
MACDHHWQRSLGRGGPHSSRMRSDGCGSSALAEVEKLCRPPGRDVDFEELKSACRKRKGGQRHDCEYVTCPAGAHRHTLRRQRMAAGGSTGRRASPRTRRCMSSRDDRGAHSHRPPLAWPRGRKRMSVTTNDYICAPDLIAAAGEFIRGEGGGRRQHLVAARRDDRQVRRPVPRVTEHVGSGSDRDAVGRLTRQSGPRYGIDRVRLARKGVPSGTCHQIEGAAAGPLADPITNKEEA